MSTGKKQGRPSSRSTGKVEDLSFRVRDFGSSYIRLEWQAGQETATEGQEPRRVHISYHPFGRQQEKVTAPVQFSVGTHRLRGLEPGTAYIVCMSLTDAGSQGQGVNKCLEVMTEENAEMMMRDVYFRVGVVILGFILLIIKCSLTSGSQRDITSRRKCE
jgi:hypothetical protein